MSEARRIGTFVTVMFAVAALLGGLSGELFGIHPVARVPAAVVIGLVALLAAGEYLVVRYTWRGQVNALNLFEAALAPALLALPGVFVIALVGVAQAAIAVFR